MRKSDLIFTPDKNNDLDAIRNQIIEHEVASRMDQIFKSKDGNLNAESIRTPIIISEQEELKKADELSIPKIDLEKLGIGVYQKDNVVKMKRLIDQNHYNSHNNSYKALPMIKKYSKLKLKRHKQNELRS